MRGKLMLLDVITNKLLDTMRFSNQPQKENGMKDKGKKKLSIKEKQDRKKEKTKTKVKDELADS
jgi:hypothetical protein